LARAVRLAKEALPSFGRFFKPANVAFARRCLAVQAAIRFFPVLGFGTMVYSFLYGLNLCHHHTLITRPATLQ